MCDPTAIALSGIAIKVGSELLDAKNQNKQSKQNTRDARISQAIQFNDINARVEQEKLAAGQEIEVAERQTRTAVSTARVAAGEAGVEGASVDALLADIGVEGSMYAQDVRLNQKMITGQLEREKLGIAATTQGRINSMPMANPWATALRIGGAALGTAAQLQSHRPPPNRKP